MTPSPSWIAVMSTLSYTISTVSSLPSDSPWKQDRLSRSFRYEGTRQTPVHRCQQRTNLHWSAYDSHHPQSVKRSIVKRCMTERSFLWPSAISHLWGKETFVISSCFKQFSLLLCTEGYETKKFPPPPPPPYKQRFCDAVQVHSGFSPCKRCIRASSPLHTTTRHPCSIQVRHDN